MIQRPTDIQIWIFTCKSINIKLVWVDYFQILLLYISKHNALRPKSFSSQENLGNQVPTRSKITKITSALFFEDWKWGLEAVTRSFAVCRVPSNSYFSSLRCHMDRSQQKHILIRVLVCKNFFQKYVWSFSCASVQRSQYSSKNPFASPFLFFRQLMKWFLNFL
jgi:hypothetical protein